MGSNRFTPPFTENQIRSFAIVQRISAALSICGSLYIIQNVLIGRKRSRRLRKVYHRIILGMSCMDLIFAIKQFVGQWAVPADEPAYGSSGTILTCTIFGFLGQGSALSSIYYSGFLTLFFYLVVRLGWSEERIKRNVEPWMHVVSLSMGWGTAIAGLPLELYNRGSTGCWIGSKPPGCQESFNNNTDNKDATTTPPPPPPPCIRGDNASLYRWIFFWSQLWIIWVFCVLAMLLIYLGIRRAERKSSIHSSEIMGHNNRQQRRRSSTTLQSSLRRLSSFRQSQSMMSSSLPTAKRKNSSKFAIQAMLYCTFFFLTWAFATIHTTLQSFANKVYSPLIVLTVFFIPLQGMFNALVYVRPRYLRYRDRQKQQKQQQQQENNNKSCLQSPPVSSDNIHFYNTTNDDDDDRQWGGGGGGGEGEEEKSPPTLTTKSTTITTSTTTTTRQQQQQQQQEELAGCVVFSSPAAVGSRNESGGASPSSVQQQQQQQHDLIIGSKGNEEDNDEEEEFPVDSQPEFEYLE